MFAGMTTEAPQAHVLTGGGELYFLPQNVPVSEMFIDESGSNGSRGRFFVLGMVKVRGTARLLRELRLVRERASFREEFKFGRVTEGTLGVYGDAVRALADSDVRIAASVFDKTSASPFAGEIWRAQAAIASQLVVGNINRGEVVNIYLDVVTTPAGVSIPDEVRDAVNARFNGRSVISALDLDSRSTELLQMADLVAGAVAYDRRVKAGEVKTEAGRATPKRKLSSLVASEFGLDDFADVKTRNGRVNIATMERGGEWLMRKFHLAGGRVERIK